jgi:hypothetical protein
LKEIEAYQTQTETVEPNDYVKLLDWHPYWKEVDGSWTIMQLLRQRRAMGGYAKKEDADADFEKPMLSKGTWPINAKTLQTTITRGMANAIIRVASVF